MKRILKKTFLIIYALIAILRLPCETDEDGDGVINLIDLCPDTIVGPGVVINPSGCAESFDPYAELEFEDEVHFLWYRHFWEGNCEGLDWPICIKLGSFGGIIDKALNGIPFHDWRLLRNRLWFLGRKIGYEWARDNDKRCINSRNVYFGTKSWADRLRRARPEEIENVMNIIEEEVNKLLRSPPHGRQCLSKPDVLF